MRTFIDAPEPTGRAGYGLGLELYRLPGGVEIVGHVGGTAGFLSFVRHLPAQDIDFAMVVNTRDDLSPALLPALELLVAEAAEGSERD